MQLSRRDFLQITGSTLLAGCASLPQPEAVAEPIIDIHQHTNYQGRSDVNLFAHQEAMGVTTTVLLPAGRFYGLDAQCGGNESVQRAAKATSQQLPFLRE